MVVLPKYCLTLEDKVKVDICMSGDAYLVKMAVVTKHPVVDNVAVWVNQIKDSIGIHSG